MNQPKAITSHHKLEAVSTLFQQWRSQSAGRRTETPVELRTHALALLQEYPRSQVVKALGINHAMLKQWQAAARPADTRAAFVVLSTPGAASHPLRELTLAFGNGSQATLRGEFSLTELTTLLSGLGSAREKHA